LFKHIFHPFEKVKIKLKYLCKNLLIIVFREFYLARLLYCLEKMKDVIAITEIRKVINNFDYSLIIYRSNDLLFSSDKIDRKNFKKTYCEECNYLYKRLRIASKIKA